MKRQSSPNTHRLSAEERREAILQAAISEFAVHGLNGASTEAIAERVGISQPYIFKIFGTKKELFIAAINRVYDDTLAAFRVGLTQHADQSPLDAMGGAFEAMVTSREELLMLLQSVASTADAEVREVVERRFRDLYAFLQQHSQEDDFEIQRFIGFGLFLAALSGMGLDRSAFTPS
jgi:AcrR family transcriptional regulator